MKKGRFTIGVATLLAVLSACGPATPGAPGASGRVAQPPAPRVLTIVVEVEPADLGISIGATTSGTGAGAAHARQIVHNTLAVEVDFDDYRPQLAADLPSLEKGTWRLNADGTMETTWRIRPNAMWHDGTPLTSAGSPASCQPSRCSH